MSTNQESSTTEFIVGCDEGFFTKNSLGRCHLRFNIFAHKSPLRDCSRRVEIKLVEQGTEYQFAILWFRYSKMRSKESLKQI
jgi:hypothetical protein